MAAAGCALLVVSLFDAMGSVRSADTMDSIRQLLSRSEAGDGPAHRVFGHVVDLPTDVNSVGLGLPPARARFGEPVLVRVFHGSPGAVGAIASGQAIGPCMTFSITLSSTALSRNGLISGPLHPAGAQCVESDRRIPSPCFS